MLLKIDLKKSLTWHFPNLAKSWGSLSPILHIKFYVFEFYIFYSLFNPGIYVYIYKYIYF